MKTRINFRFRWFGSITVVEILMTNDHEIKGNINYLVERVTDI